VAVVVAVVVVVVAAGTGIMGGAAGGGRGYKVTMLRHCGGVGERGGEGEQAGKRVYSGIGIKLQDMIFKDSKHIYTWYYYELDVLFDRTGCLLAPGDRVDKPSRWLSA
jgi:hypothetical protein